MAGGGQASKQNKPLTIHHNRYILAAMNGNQVIAKLKAAGWTLDRINGSHHILVKNGQRVPVPVHGSRDFGPGLIAAIARQTGVKLK